MAQEILPQQNHDIIATDGVDDLPLNERNSTRGMKDSLNRLRELLLCPLCNKVFTDPTTLASCSHSFCVVCIDSYCCNNSACPVEGCLMPISMVGSKGKYRKVNPQLRQIVSSLNGICQGLNNAPDFWWKPSPEDEEENHDDDDMTDTEEFVNNDINKPGQPKDDMAYLEQEE